MANEDAPSGHYVPTTRREARLAFEAREAAAKKLAALEPKANRLKPTAATNSKSAPKKPQGVKKIASAFSLLVAAGLVTTIAIPAYAFNPNSTAQGQLHFGATAVDSLKQRNAQSVAAPQNITLKAAVDTYSSTSAAALAAQQQAQQAAVDAAAAAKATAELAAYSAAYSGPTSADYLKNPPYPHFSLSQVFSVAKKYLGVPYVYGGATPAGFDCSGFVMFVYSQFGIALPHSASEQGAIGKVISPADARPGDVIVLDDGSHDGFYAGPGMILDASHPGGEVSIRPLWTSAYYIVRFGI